jgi:hypothetical protein
LSIWLYWETPKTLGRHISECVCEGVSREDWYIGQLREKNPSWMWAVLSSRQRAWMEKMRNLANTWKLHCSQVSGSVGATITHGHQTPPSSGFQHGFTLATLWAVTRPSDWDCTLISLFIRLPESWTEQLSGSYNAGGHCCTVQLCKPIQLIPPL